MSELWINRVFGRDAIEKIQRCRAATGERRIRQQRHRCHDAAIERPDPTAINDAPILLKATSKAGSSSPRLQIVRGQLARQAFQEIVPDVQILPLDEPFVMQDSREAAEKLLKDVSGILSPANEQSELWRPPPLAVTRRQQLAYATLSPARKHRQAAVQGPHASAVRRSVIRSAARFA